MRFREILDGITTMSERNENRPGFKKTKIGWIPETWEIKKLGSLGFLSKGKGISINEKRNTGSPCITYGEIYTTYNIAIKELKSFIDRNSVTFSKSIKKHDLLFAGSGETLDEIGKCVAYVNNETAYAGGDIIILTPNQKVNSIYLSYSLNSNYMTRYRRKLGQGHSVVHIYSSGLKKLYVPIPKLIEQKRIAEILTTWNRAIEKLQKLIEVKKKFKRGLMQQLLTGRLRFSEFGEPVTEKEDLPKGWEIKHLGECFGERIEHNPDLPLLSITSDRGVIPREEVERKDLSNENKSKYKCIVPGDIGYNTMRMWQGVSALSSLEGIVSPAYTICIPKKEKNHPSFFKYLFKFPAIINKFHRYSQGLVSDTLNLKFTNFARIKISSPQVDEQKKIAALLDKIDKEIDVLLEKQKFLKEQKKGLMQKLLTGEVRVSVGK